MTPASRLADVGAAVLGAGRAMRALWGVYVATWAGVARPRPRGEVVRQMYQIGNRSIVFIAVTLGFIGMVMAYEACRRSARSRR